MHLRDNSPYEEESCATGGRPNDAYAMVGFAFGVYFFLAMRTMQTTHRSVIMSNRVAVLLYLCWDYITSEFHVALDTLDDSNGISKIGGPPPRFTRRGFSLIGPDCLAAGS